MQPENIRISLRPRGGWEAIDLGFRMARVWWRPLFGAWLAVVVPTALLLNIVFWDSLWIAAVLTWWLKPLFDRVALSVLSEALFGRVPRLSETLRKLPSLLRTGLVGSLTLYRLSPMRSLVLPVLQLEGLRGRGRRARARLLVGREFNLGFGLILACLHFELLVACLGLLSLIWIFLPAGFGPSLWDLVSGWFVGQSRGTVALGNGVLVLAMSAIEPFYVAGGFSAYVNRRVYLEGWDIELEFRKLARRGASPTRRVALLLALAAVLLGAPEGRANECSEEPRAAKACIESVMASPEFSTLRSVELWVPKGAPAAEEGSRGTPSGMSELGELLALLFQVGLWVAAALVLVGLVRRLLRRSTDAGRAPDDASERPEVTLGPAARPESLPLDLVADARARFAEGDAIAALSVLYRGALAYLRDARGLGLPASATEGECAALVRGRVEDELARDFDELALAWQRCAYAGRRPEPPEFHALCEGWRPRLESPA
jgi:hypothetical protein